MPHAAQTRRCGSRSRVTPHRPSSKASEPVFPTVSARRNTLKTLQPLQPPVTRRNFHPLAAAARCGYAQEKAVSRPHPVCFLRAGTKQALLTSARSRATSRCNTQSALGASRCPAPRGVPC